MLKPRTNGELIQKQRSGCAKHLLSITLAVWPNIAVRYGPDYLGMTRRLSLRLLAVPLILAVLVLGTQVVAHYDGDGHDEAHCTCQVCHIAHAAVPQPAAQAQIEVPFQISRFAPAETTVSRIESASVLSIPRAPPA